MEKQMDELLEKEKEVADAQLTYWKKMQYLAELKIEYWSKKNQ